MVMEAIRRDEVDAVLANLHFCDNTAMTGEDRYQTVFLLDDRMIQIWIRSRIRI